jgi:hypothetical protein
VDLHWNFFLALERDADVLSRYVEFDSRNYDCFSIEIARILASASGEVDVVAKQLCRAADPHSTAADMIDYRRELMRAYPGIPDLRVKVPRFGLELKPWEQWKRHNGVPLWWTAYNKIKHDRNGQYRRATLKNALNAAAGLFVMVLHLYRDKAQAGELLPSPQLFRPDNAHYDATVHNGLEVGISYRL